MTGPPDDRRPPRSTRSSRRARAMTARPACCSAARASPRTIRGPRPTARSTRPSPRSASPGPSSASRTSYGVLTPSLGGLAELVLRFQRELFVVGAELATTPDAWDRPRMAGPASRRRWSTASSRSSSSWRRRSRCRASSWCRARPRTSAAIELARTILRRAERRAVSLREAAGLPTGRSPSRTSIAQRTCSGSSLGRPSRPRRVGRRRRQSRREIRRAR